MSLLSRVTYFGILLIVILLGSDPPADQVFPHGVGESKVVIPSGRHISVLDQRKVEMSVEILLQFRHILDAGEASHWDLFLPVVVGQGLRHGGTSCSGSGLLTLEECKQYDSRRSHNQARRQSKRGTHPNASGSAVLKARRWILSRGWSRLGVLGEW